MVIGKLQSPHPWVITSRGFFITVGTLGTQKRKGVYALSIRDRRHKKISRSAAKVFSANKGGRQRL
jgi:hypothetical protein